MDISGEVQQFLTQMRSRLSPGDVGIPDRGEDRRVPGLRREEVALLAGVSLTYFIRIERGRLKGVSAEVLHAIARALRMSEPEAQYLFDLARAETAGTRVVGPSARTDLADSVLRLMSTMADVPAIALGRIGDPIGGNALGRALFPDLFPENREPLNHARYVFLDNRSRTFYVNWDESAQRVVSFLRLLAGQNPFDRQLDDLVHELSTGSAEFRVRWAGQAVDTHTSGSKTIRHPIVGDLTLEFETMILGSAPDVRIGTYLAGPGTLSFERLDRLRVFVKNDLTDEGPRPMDCVGRDTLSSAPEFVSSPLREVDR